MEIDFSVSEIAKLFWVGTFNYRLSYLKARKFFFVVVVLSYPKKRKKKKNNPIAIWY